MTKRYLNVLTTTDIKDTVTGELIRGSGIGDLLNQLNNENEQLKSQLRIYRRIASCSNCDYHDYDEFENSDGSYDEFEVCRKGNDVTERICENWKEL